MVFTRPVFSVYCCIGLATLISIIAAVPVNRQVGLSSNVYIDLRNDTKGNEQSVCMIDDVLYQDGDTVPTASPCEICICRPPGFACTLVTCEAKPGCRALQRSNQCCPEYKCECERNGRVYQNGEKLENPETPCEVCYCQSGEIVCTVIECYKRDDCEATYVPGRCCPKYDHCPPIDFRPERPAPASFRPPTSTVVETGISPNGTVLGGISTEISDLETVATEGSTLGYPKVQSSEESVSSESSSEQPSTSSDEKQTYSTEESTESNISTEKQDSNTMMHDVIKEDELYNVDNNITISNATDELLSTNYEVIITTEETLTINNSEDSLNNDIPTTEIVAPFSAFENTENIKSSIDTIQSNEISETNVNDSIMNDEPPYEYEKTTQSLISTAIRSQVTTKFPVQSENLSDLDTTAAESVENDENTTDVALRNIPLGDSSVSGASTEPNDENEIGSGWDHTEHSFEVFTSTDPNSLEQRQFDKEDQNNTNELGSGNEEQPEDASEGSGFDQTSEKINEGSGSGEPTEENKIGESSSDQPSEGKTNEESTSDESLEKNEDNVGTSTLGSTEGSGFFNAEYSDTPYLSNTNSDEEPNSEDKGEVYTIVTNESEDIVNEVTSEKMWTINFNVEYSNNLESTVSTVQNLKHIYETTNHNVEDDNLSGDGNDGMLDNLSRITQDKLYNTTVSSDTDDTISTTDYTIYVENSDESLVINKDVTLSESSFLIQNDPASVVSDNEWSGTVLSTTENTNPSSSVVQLNNSSPFDLKILPEVNEFRPNKSNGITESGNKTKSNLEQTGITLPDEWLKQNEPFSTTINFVAITGSNNESTTEYVISQEEKKLHETDSNNGIDETGSTTELATEITDIVEESNSKNSDNEGKYIISTTYDIYHKHDVTTIDFSYVQTEATSLLPVDAPIQNSQFKNSEIEEVQSEYKESKLEINKGVHSQTKLDISVSETPSSTDTNEEEFQDDPKNDPYEGIHSQAELNISVTTSASPSSMNTNEELFQDDPKNDPYEGKHSETELDITVTTSASPSSMDSNEEVLQDDPKSYPYEGIHLQTELDTSVMTSASPSTIDTNEEVFQVEPKNYPSETVSETTTITQLYDITTVTQNGNITKDIQTINTQLPTDITTNVEILKMDPTENPKGKLSEQNETKETNIMKLSSIKNNTFSKIMVQNTNLENTNEEIEDFTTLYADSTSQYEENTDTKAGSQTSDQVKENILVN